MSGAATLAQTGSGPRRPDRAYARAVESGFVRANTRLGAPALVPEVRLHLAGEAFDLWTRTREPLGCAEPPPPFWAFAWSGGQALARFLLDHPKLPAGRSVLDVGSGSGLVAIAAAKAGAAAVTASEVDALAIEAIALNAEANGVVLEIVPRDVLDGDGEGADLVLAADVFYDRPLADRVLAFLDRVRRRGAAVLIGDPGRAHLPLGRFQALAVYDVPVTAGLEDAPVKRATVLRPA